MKIKELKNAPDWLLDAKVENENVEINNNGIVIWKDGIWKGGRKSIGFCKWAVYYTDKYIQIGCKTMSIKEWNDFFESNGEIETSRGTDQFEQIRKSYLLAKYAIELKL